MKREQIIEFVSDIIKVYKKHNLSLAHEDRHGAFIIEKLNDENVDWLEQALYSSGGRMKGLSE
jgi:hypothetical protein